jgi:4-amino-4-deoxy-L-arabinose transferase-like glycosyltransferase
VAEVAARVAPERAPKVDESFATRRFSPVLVAITLAGLAWRVAYVWFIRRHVTLHISDALYYHASANLLATGHGFILPFAPAGHAPVQAADHPPLYIVYLAAFSLAGVRSITGHLLASTLLGAASIAVAGLAGREIAGARVGLVAAMLVAVYPNTWRYDGMMLSETMVILVSLVCVWLAYRYWDHPTRGRMIAVGAAVGLAALSRSELVLLALFLVVPLALLTPGASRRLRLRRTVVGLAAFATVLAPWVAFNMARFDHTVLMSQNVGGTLATSNCDYVYYGRLIGYWNYQCGVHYLTDRHINGLNGAADRAEFNGGMAYIKSHLGRVPLVMAARVGRISGVFKPRENAQLDVYLEYTTPWVSYWGMYLYYPVALLAVVGGVILRRRGRPVFPLLAPIVAVLVTVALFYAATRFRAAAEGALCLLAAVAIDAGLSAAGRYASRRPAESLQA